MPDKTLELLEKELKKKDKELKKAKKHADDLGDLLAKRDDQLGNICFLIKSAILNITDYSFAKAKLIEALSVIRQ